MVTARRGFATGQWTPGGGVEKLTWEINLWMIGDTRGLALIW